MADNFTFEGTVEVLHRRENLGLREHILKCGDLALDHGAVIVLEDDLVVSTDYYKFACEAASYYDDSERIAGVALYSPAVNELAWLPFVPMYNGSSGYLMQVPCSWGQVWTGSQWKKFRVWYNANVDLGLHDVVGLPAEAADWPASSWKKYFYAYLIRKGLYFFYPYSSYTTNCSDGGGVHIKNGTDLFQVALVAKQSALQPSRFLPWQQHSVKYDAYMEPEAEEMFRALGLTREELAVDFYGTKPMRDIGGCLWVLTSRTQRNWGRSFALKYKPFEKIYLGEIQQEGSEIPRAQRIYLVKTAEFDSSQRASSALVSYFCGMPMTSPRFLTAVLSEFRMKIAGRLRALIQR